MAEGKREPCFFCGQPYQLWVTEVYPEDRAFTMDACCEGAYEDAVAWLNEPIGPGFEVPRKEFADWFKAQTGIKVRGCWADEGGRCRYYGLALDFGLKIRPITQALALEKVAAWHRHLPTPPHSTGWIWGYGVWNGPELIAVAMVGAPVGRFKAGVGGDPKTIAEVSRVAVRPDLRRGLVWNAASMIYGEAAREAKQRGYERIITYTRADESGVSLKAAGWTPGKLGRARQRVDPRGGRRKGEKIARRRWTKWLKPGKGPKAEQQQLFRDNPRHRGLSPAQVQLLMEVGERYFTPLAGMDYVRVNDRKQTAMALERKNYVTLTKVKATGEWQARLSNWAKYRTWSLFGIPPKLVWTEPDEPKRENPEERLGNCYQLAAELVLDQDRWSQPGPRYTLVHGRPRLQRPPWKKYGHAWVEYDDEQGQRMVRDPVADVVMPAILYYALGDIDAADNHRYDAEQARIWMLKTRHWGPWEGPESVGPIQPRENPIPASLTPFKASDLKVRHRSRKMDPPWPERAMGVVLFVRVSALASHDIEAEPEFLESHLYGGITPKTPPGFAAVGYIALVEQPKAQKYGGLWFVQGAHLLSDLRNTKLGLYLYSAAIDVVRRDKYGATGIISDSLFRSEAATRLWDSRTLPAHGYPIERDVLSEGDRIAR